MLDDLARHNVVEVRRNSGLKRLPLLREGRPDFMQEYEIWDLTALPPTPLWYAHFHYNRRAATFDQFEKAHLKLPEHRGLTHGDDPTLPFSDIGKNPRRCLISVRCGSLPTRFRRRDARQGLNERL